MSNDKKSKQTEEKKIQQWRDWCQKARQIVGLGLKGKSATMDKQISRTAEMLKKLSRQTEKTDRELYQTESKRFEELAKEHLRLAEEHKASERTHELLEKQAKELEAKAGKKKYKNDKTVQEAAIEARKLADQASADVDKKREEIKALIPKMEQLMSDLLDDEPLARAIHQFEVEVRKAREQLLLVQTQSGATPSDIKEILDWLDWAEKQAQYQDDPAAIDGLRKDVVKMARDLTGKQRESGEQTSKTELQQSRAKPLAMRRLYELREMFKDLKGTGLLTQAIELQLDGAIMSADKLELVEDWLGIEELLRKLPSREQCNAAFLKAQAETVREYKQPIELLDKALAALDDLLDVDTQAQLLARRNHLVARAAHGSRNDNDIAQTLQAFVALTQEFKDRKLSADELRNTVTQRYGTLSLKVKNMDDVAPLHRAEENRRLLDAISSLRQEQRFGEALEVAESLERSLSTQDTTAYEAWRKIEPELRSSQFTTALVDAVKTPGITAPLLNQVQQLQANLSPKDIDRLILLRDWHTLVSRHAAAKSFMADLPQRIQAHHDFDKERESSRQLMDASWARCRDALSELREGLTKAGADPGPVLKGLEAGLQRIQAEWERKVLDASSVDDLALDASEAAVVQWLGEAVSLASIEDALQAEGERAFRLEAAKIEGGDLVALRLVSTGQAAEYASEIARIGADASKESDPKQPWAQRLLALANLGERVAQARLDEATRCGQLNDSLKLEAEQVRLLLTQTENALKTKLKDKVGFFSASKFEPLVTALRDELENLIGLTTTGNTSAAEGNKKLLASLNARILTLQSLINNSSAMESTIQSLEECRKKLAQLKSAGLELEAESSAQALSTQLTGLEERLYGLEPKAAGLALTEMKNALEAAALQLQAIKDKRLKASRDAEGLKQRLAVFAKLGFAEPLRKSLDTRIKSAIAKIPEADSLGAAVTELAALDIELKEIEADPQATALQMQTNLLKDQQAKARQKQEYESLLTLLKEDVKRIDKIVEDAGGDAINGGQVAEVNRIIKLAKKTAGAGNFEQAVQYLTKATLRVREVERNPQGTGLGARNALPQHASHYGGEVGKLRGALDGFLAQALKEVDTDLQERLKKALQPALAPLKQQLNPRLFEQLVARIAAKDAPVAERRAARAEALARLRQVRDFLTKQPALTALRPNPVLPISPEWQLTDISLTRLEAHLRSAIR